MDNYGFAVAPQATLTGNIVIPMKGILSIEVLQEPWTKEEVIECLRSNLSLRIRLGRWGWEEDDGQ